MTKHSPIITSSVALKSENKGSTYGKPQSWSSDHSFQRPQGNDGFDNQNGIKVLYVKAYLYSSQSGCIIKVDEFTRGPTNTRS